MAKQIILLLFVITSLDLMAQQRVGINTTTPARTLHVNGTSNQYLRIHSSTAAGGQTGLELVRGTNDLLSKDWKLINDGPFRILNSDDNFATAGNEVMRITSVGNVGLGTAAPISKMHIDGGTLLAFGGDGYLKIGSQSSTNLAFDNSQLVALNNNNPASLYFQANGGNTNFGLNGGNTYMGIGGGKVGVGTTTLDAGLNITDDNFQLSLENDTDDSNSWYIGASNNNWQAGDNQLLFSPTSSSDDAVLRLMDVSENDGTNAPVMIHTSNDHTILMDGNEIDTRGTPLYINHNTDQETYINPSGGRVGIGTTNPQAMLHVNTSTTHVLTLQRGSAKWHIDPLQAGNENLGFYWYSINGPFAQVDGMSGQWLHISDRNYKENITSLPGVLDRLKQLRVYSYSFKKDENHSDQVGVIAQEAADLFPEMVKINEGQYGVAYSQLAAVGIKAIKEQQELIEKLKEKIKKLKTDSLENEKHISSTASN